MTAPNRRAVGITTGVVEKTAGYTQLTAVVKNPLTLEVMAITWLADMTQICVPSANLTNYQLVLLPRWMMPPVGTPPD